MSNSLKPLFSVVIVFVTLLGLTNISPPADAATVNTLNRFCNKSSRTTSCVVDPGSVDQLVKARSITFRDATGAPHTYRSATGVWNYARSHSSRCVWKGDVKGCYYVDDIAGRAIVLHDGISIAVDKFFRR